MTRLLVLGGSLAFVAGFAFLTVATIIREGVTTGTVFSALIVILLFVGIVGALLHPPRE
jgi:hypothetical protein